MAVMTQYQNKRNSKELEVKKKDKISRGGKTKKNKEKLQKGKRLARFVCQGQWDSRSRCDRERWRWFCTARSAAPPCGCPRRPA